MSGQFDRVFVLYPRGASTGGPEALHQLVDALRSLGQDATLVPFSQTRNRTRSASYQRYDAPESALIDDRPGNAVIAPESALDRLRSVRRATRICWWLSVDYALPFFARQERADRHFVRKLGAQHSRWSPTLASAIYSRAGSLTPRTELFRESLHIAQSAYARAYLQTHVGLASSVVSDYIARDGVDPIVAPVSRGRSIAYNPKRSGWVPQVLSDLLPDIQWRPIENMDSAGVRAALSQTTVYFDPGFHPGRDRLPREAALAGAVTVPAFRGSACYWEDMPLPWEHKVSVSDDFPREAQRIIGSVLLEPEAAVQRQQSYLSWVKNDSVRFREEVRRVFVDGRWGDDSPVVLEQQ